MKNSIPFPSYDDFFNFSLLAGKWLVITRAPDTITSNVLSSVRARRLILASHFSFLIILLLVLSSPRICYELYGY